MTKKISELSAATTPLAGTETVEIVQGGVSKNVAVSYLAGSGLAVREILTAARTYYVRTDGSNSNDGLSNTSGGAFLTIQKAIDTVSGALDIGNYDVTIQVGDGTYTGANSLKPVLAGTGTVTIQGNTGAMSSVIINPTAATCFTTSASGYLWTLRYMKLTTTTSGAGIYVGAGSRVYYNNIDFGACPSSAHVIAEQGGKAQCNGSYSITGAAAYHNQAISYGEIRTTGAYTITITGTPAFTTYAYSGLGFIHYASVTFSGSATGKRYDVVENGLIKTYGGGASFLPGGTAGTTATGGQYT
jgi:hypothetical protein